MSERFAVLKFGGTSVGGEERLPRVLEHIERARAEGPIAVVVSAMMHTTDHLLEAIERARGGDRDGALAIASSLRGLAETRARQLGVGRQAALFGELSSLQDDLARVLEGIALLGDVTPRARDRVLSFGERASVRVVAAALTARGLRAAPIDATTWTKTDETYGHARVDLERTRAAVAEQVERWRQEVTIHTGFLGQSPDGHVTTLGRNGSDYTASLLAWALGAREVVLWTDVSGVMTADPSLVAQARPVARLTYHEAIELSALGLGMLHPRTMEPLIAAGVPVRVRNVLRPDDPGTVVDAAGEGDVTRPVCIVSLDEQALLGVEARPGGAPIGRRAGAALAEVGIAARMETQIAGGQAVALVVSEKEAESAEAVLSRSFSAEGAKVTRKSPVTLLTLVAEAMGQTPNVAGRFFGALGAVGINVRASAQGATSRSISAVIDAADEPVAVRTVHAAFHLARARASVLLLGKGTVGGELLSQIAAQAETLAREHDVGLEVVGIVGRSQALFDERGIELSSWRAQYEAAPGHDGEGLTALLDRLRALPMPVLVDCTAEDGMESVYGAAFARGIHVVAANKKVFAGPLSSRKAVFAAARGAHRALRYETTVGASLPVLETLKNLVRTGDRVVRVEGSLSGTLGFLAQEVSRGAALDAAVRDARARGYTEPHPRDDLSGTDAARKALILARELGLSIELGDVAVEPFVPAALLAHDELEPFYAALAAYAPKLAAQVEGLAREGRVLRYLVQVELNPERADRAEGALASAKLRVGPVGVPLDHPAARLRGSEALVAFTTQRYAEYPLLVQGAGAGGAVTAAGVLADVLAIAQGLRGV
jgi:aspartokinase/homoserine dehydrogenase 1